jgi:hypothetical protein
MLFPPAYTTERRCAEYSSGGRKLNHEGTKDTKKRRTIFSSVHVLRGSCGYNISRAVARAGK